MNGRLSLALVLAALASAAQAEIHTRSSFTITIGNRPPPRVVVVEREAPPPRVVYVEHEAPRRHARKVVYLESRRRCGPERIVVLRGREHDRRDAWIRRDRDVRTENGEARFEGRESDRDDRVAMDDETRSINR